MLENTIIVPPSRTDLTAKSREDDAPAVKNTVSKPTGAYSLKDCKVSSTV